MPPKKHTSYFAHVTKQEQWGKALTLLRGILLSSEMEETGKWGAPVYTINGKNVAGLAAFKSYGRLVETLLLIPAG
ncbi:MAG: hypothetical protein EPO28_19055 [Saprospiraceae bacterium]|nr:MAG: hypothetical protein EPO28_19055 [Saprospiraceae bacterium]